LIIVGNDIVDLEESLPSRKSQDTRFLNRVFTANEQSLILSSDNPELQLWLFWAAKETAYKVISKMKTPPVFSHKLFQVSIQSNIALSGSQQVLFIQYDDDVVYATGIWDKNKLHVAGYLDTEHPLFDTQDITFQLIKQQNKKHIHNLTMNEINYWSDQNNINLHFSQAEQTSINHAASAVAKYKLKKNLAQNMGWNIKQLEVIRPSLNKKMHPPFLLYQNEKTSIDISLSHHGQWVAWVYHIFDPVSPPAF